MGTFVVEERVRETEMQKIYYSVAQAAGKLGLSVRQVESMISSKELPVVPVGNRRVIPANAVENVGKKGTSAKGAAPPKTGHPSRTAQASLADRDKEYYTDVEVAQRLNKPYTEIYRMANLGGLPVTFVDDKRVFPKEAIDDLAAKRTSPGKTVIKPNRRDGVTASGGSHHNSARKAQENASSGSLEPATSKPLESQKSADEYFTPEQIAYALNRTQEYVDQLIRRGEIETARIGDRHWISREEVSRLVSKRQGSRQEKIRRRLPIPRRLRIDNNENASRPEGGAYPETVRDAAPRATERQGSIENQGVIEVSERMIMEVAQRIGISINRVRGMIGTGELVVDRDGKRLVSGTSREGTRKSRESLPDQPLRARVEELESALRAKEAENHVLNEELEQEKAWHKKEVQDAQHEIGQLDVQLENLRNEKKRATERLNLKIEDLELELERLASQLEQETERREDAEHSARNLQRLLGEDDDARTQATSEPQNTVRGFLKDFGRNVRDALSPEEADDASEQQELRKLEDELKREQEAREQDKLAAQYEHAQLENARRDLEEQSRALKKELEEALYLEKQKARRLEADARLLDEVRRLLGTVAAVPEEPGDPPGPVGDNAIGTSANGGSRGDAVEIGFQTRHGWRMFRPPFVLEDEEIELIRLVAGEPEITADQIRRKKGRRSVEKLNSLLDRLYDTGVEPIIEDNDRYSFDPEFMRDQ